MSHGRPPKERLNIPEGVDVFQYGNQKLNIWEFQKEQLRQQIAKDQTKFYTYSKDYLALAFPLVNENEIHIKEKEENESKWKTKSGFDNVMKRLNWNEHPKRPDPSTVESLKHPYHKQVLATKQQLKGHDFIPGENGKPDFQSKVKARHTTLSHPDYFKTVFISGEEQMRQEEADRLKEIGDWEKKVVVDNKHFTVNTMEKQKVVQLDRYLNIREDPVKKIGLRHSKGRVTALAGRQIMATRHIEDAPVSMLKEEEYKLAGWKPPFKKFDPVKSITTKDMETAIHPNDRIKSPQSKLPIRNMDVTEKLGPKWGK